MLSNLSTNLPRHLSLKFIKAYIDSGDLVRAGNLFDKIPKPDFRTCAVLITAYTRCGLPKEAIKVYDGLRALNISPNKLVLLSVAKACATLADPAKAREVHKDAIQLGFHSDLLLGNALIHMYGKCKSLEGAKRAFDDLSSKDVVSWTSIVSCYVTCGLSRDALVAFREMWLNGVRPNSVSVLSVLPACSDLQNLDLGREIHGFAVKMGIGDNVCFGSALVHMYASCLRIRQAQFVFDNMSRRDVVSWNVILSAYFLNKECEKAFNLFMQMKEERVKLNHASWNAVIGGCVQNGLTEKAVEVLGEMQCSGLRPNQITIISLLSAFTNLESLRGGKEVHSYLFRHCFIDDLTTMTALVFMKIKIALSLQLEFETALTSLRFPAGPDGQMLRKDNFSSKAETPVGKRKNNQEISLPDKSATSGTVSFGTSVNIPMPDNSASHGLIWESTKKQEGRGNKRFLSRTEDSLNCQPGLRKKLDA
ncbi:Pentatricopeptide repeat [Dillenia turbinata]|uniref:Pentatricopeptide repeat n=1 Tax=Dillenia turbinata TaxID=194707 RepID=A0AAN8ZRB5_9MAGN